MVDEFKDWIPIEVPPKENELFIESLSLKLNRDYNEYLKINSKVLHDTDKVNLNFDILVYDSTDINPFDDEIEFFFEFIENEQPYIQIISNFLRPTMYDMKNYYLCLSSQINYVFKSNDLPLFQIILEEIISNIQLFLYHIKDCDSFKIFIYFGEYNRNKIYHINDFLRNSQIIDFFRINKIKEDKFYDKLLYIICTEIYFIVIEPIENDKSLGKILFYKKLSDIEVNFEEIGYCYDNKEVKKRLKVIINEKKNKKLYKDSDEEIKSNHKVKIIQLSSIENNINSNFNISAKSESFEIFRENVLKKESIKKKKRNSLIEKSDINNIKIKGKNIINIDSDEKNTFEFLFYNSNEEDDNDILILQNQYISFKRIIAKKGILDDIKYNSIITIYRYLFGHPDKYIEKTYSLNKLKEEIDNLIEYNIKLYEKYKEKKTPIDTKIMRNSINNIIYLCNKIIGILNNETKINYYIKIMEKYALIEK